MHSRTLGQATTLPSRYKLGHYSSGPATSITIIYIHGRPYSGVTITRPEKPTSRSSSTFGGSGRIAQTLTSLRRTTPRTPSRHQFSLAFCYNMKIEPSPSRSASPVIVRYLGLGSTYLNHANTPRNMYPPLTGVSRVSILRLTKMQRRNRRIP